MRQITNDSVNAFLNGKNFKKGNMEVLHVEENEATYLYLHDNVIAKRLKGKLSISSCGWKTNTTKERLNALPNVHIMQANFIWYLNGKEWDGKMIEVK